MSPPDGADIGHRDFDKGNTRAHKTAPKLRCIATTAPVSGVFILPERFSAGVGRKRRRFLSGIVPRIVSSRYCRQLAPFIPQVLPLGWVI